MKKGLYYLAVTALLAITTAIPTLAGTIPKVNLNGTKVLMQQSPFVQNGRTYVPLRAVSENLGAKVSWEGKTQTITIEQGYKVITCRINNDTARVNNQIVKLDAPPQLKLGTTYVPLRFTADCLGATVNFDKKTNTIDITYDLPKDNGQKYDYLERKIRTTNLPKNAANYSYILESVPNEMYEMKSKFEIMKWAKPPVENKDYVKAVNLQKIYPKYNEKALDVFKTMLEKNLDARLNVSHKTADTTWSKELKSTYFDTKHKEIDNYASYVKNNKLTIEGDFFVEPSTTYYCKGPVMRCWVKFMIKSDTVKEASIYQMGLVNVKTNTLYQGYIDISIASKDGGNIIENFRVTEDFVSGADNVKEVKQSVTQVSSRSAEKGSVVWEQEK